MRFLLDANTFITAKNAYYGFDIAPGFWAWIERSHGAGDLASVDAVRKELLLGSDDLSDWAKAHAPLFLKPSVGIPRRISELAVWAMSRQPAFTDTARSEFLDDSADLILVAHAADSGATVVTFETSAPLGKRRVKIPDACAALGVPCVDLWACMRQTRPAPRLVLAP